MDRAAEVQTNTEARVNFACKRSNFVDAGGRVKNSKILRTSLMDAPLRTESADRNCLGLVREIQIGTELVWVLRPGGEI